MTITAKFSFLIAAIIFVAACCRVAAVDGLAVQKNGLPSGPGNSLSFSSGLWKSEYLGSDGNGLPGNGASGESRSLAGGLQGVTPLAAVPGTIPSLTESTLSQSTLSQSTPGGLLTEPHAQQLLVTTAINSVNQTAAFSTEEGQTNVEGEPTGPQFTPLNAWQVAQARASGSPVQTADNPGGPTLTVYLVGLVALIVLGGTALSGRE